MDRILLIEDETSISEPLAFLLGRSGFEVTVIDNGVDAIGVFDRSMVDLVLLDLELPGVPGTHLCRQLRHRSSVRFIMLTARDAESDTVAGLDAGRDDYVTKPFSSGELIARMRAVLRRGQPPEPTPFRVLGNARVRMDLPSHQVTRWRCLGAGAGPMPGGTRSCGKGPRLPGSAARGGACDGVHRGRARARPGDRPAHPTARGRVLPTLTGPAGSPASGGS